MDKVDLSKLHKPLYATGKKALEPQMVEVPPLNCLMIDGEGDPNCSAWFEEAMQALYTVAYTLKFDRKHRGIEPDYRIMPLEGLWRMADDSEFDPGMKSAWAWTMLIVQPDFITAEEIQRARGVAAAKKEVPRLNDLRLEVLREGNAAQVLHLGPYAEEAPTIIRLHAFIEEQGFTPRGLHHEIYMSDPRRTAPEKLKTIIRQPVGQ